MKIFVLICWGMKDTVEFDTRQVRVWILREKFEFGRDRDDDGELMFARYGGR